MTTKMNRLNALASFAKAAELLITSAAEANVTAEEIAHLRAIEPEFDAVANRFVELFGLTTTNTTTPPSATEPEEEEQQPEVAIETASEMVIPMAPLPVPVEATNSTEVWKEHPDLEGVELSTLGHVRVNGLDVTPRMVGGYMKFYVGPGKVYALAAAVLTTFSGHTNNSMVPVYKDGNKENCRLDNLRWGMRECTLSTSAVERACKIIADNPDLNESDMLNLLVREKTIRSVTALRSILSGNWRTISDRYFVVRRGSIIPTTTTTTETTVTTIQPTPAEPEVDDSGNLRGILSLTNDPTFVRKLYGERVDARKVSTDDQVALILSYIMDGKDSAPEIQRAIRKDFGKRVMISNSEIQRIIG